FTAVSSILVGTALTGAAALNRSWVSATSQHLVKIAFDVDEVCTKLPDDAYFAPDYSSHATLAYRCQSSSFDVIGSRSKFGRENDKHLDFSALDGTDLNILSLQENDVARFAPYFESSGVEAIQVNDRTEIFILRGQAFKYLDYKRDFILPTAQNYYAVPDWWPFPVYACPFRDKYGIEPSTAH
ncbi:MAG TPA: hypothetical protein VLA51_11185, partial [Paracoccaceae bacterium]|nr:hypothetical protein [Paracoccaceae bacterium]